MHVFFTKQTIVKSIKVLVPFQGAEETCKNYQTDFSDEGNKITLGERGSTGINYASVQLWEDLQAKMEDHVHAHQLLTCLHHQLENVTAVKLMKITGTVSPSKKRRLR